MNHKAGFSARARWLLLALLVIPGASAQAGNQDKTNSGFQALPPPPPPPRNYRPPSPPAESTDRLPAPDISIKTHGKTRYEEYRIGGMLYMIKVIPAMGPPYYLIDKEGSGQFRRSNVAPGVSPPMWIIKRF
ncbi:MAG: DUF2782 domain-containing protein [Acidiferrobacterales bacterium]